MANQTFNDVQSRTKAVKLLHGRLRILGNTTPANGTFSVIEGDGILSLTRTGTGLYRITLRDKYQKLVGAKFQILAATITQGEIEIAAEDVDGATPYVDFRFKAPTNSSTTTLIATDTANDVTIDVFVELALKNTNAR